MESYKLASLGEFCQFIETFMSFEKKKFMYNKLYAVSLL